MDRRAQRGQGRGVGEEEGRARQEPPPRLRKHGASALGLGRPQAAFNGETLQKKVLKKTKKSLLCAHYLPGTISRAVTVCEKTQIHTSSIQ